MFAKFNYKPSLYYGNIFNQCVQQGRELFDETQTKVRKELKEFILENGNIDGTKLKDHWFNAVDADIFLSHSHKDLEKVKGFAGWLYKTFGLKVFIDSCVWGYCDDLLKEIDKKYCWQPKSDTYNYVKRNHTTSHVHMMLASSLTEMIDRCECAIFFNTPNSIKVCEEIKQVDVSAKERTISPWIYHELSVLNTIQSKKPPERQSLRHSATIYEAKDLNIEYDVGMFLDKMIPLNDSIIKEWKDNYNPYIDALDQLYKIVSASCK